MTFARKPPLLAVYTLILLASGFVYSVLYTNYLHSPWKTYQDIQQSLEDNTLNPLVEVAKEDNSTKPAPTSGQVSSNPSSITKWDDNSSQIFWVEDLETLAPPPPLLTPYVLSIEKFSFVINSLHTCNSSDSIAFLFIVISAPRNRYRRRAIRDTWGAQVRLNEDNRLIFFTGLDAKENENEKLVIESNTHNDIVQSDFVDSYKNLTWKSLLFLRWVRENCPQATYVFKADDDILLNTRTLQIVMESRPFSIRAITGHLARKWRVIRDPKSKWFVSRPEYPAPFLPSFLTGPAYVLGGQIIEPLLSNCLQVPYFFLEDVYITGMCARKADVPIINHPDITNKHTAIERCYYNSVITSHSVTSDQLITLWRHMDLETGRLTSCRKVGFLQGIGRRGRRRH